MRYWSTVVAAVAMGCGAVDGLDVPRFGVRDSSVTDAVRVDASVDERNLRDLCVDLDRSTSIASLDVTFLVQLGRVDVAIVLDTTSSMGFIYDALRVRFRTDIVPGIREVVPDAQFAVATFGDFPLEPFGDPEKSYPFRLRAVSSANPPVVQAAIDATTSSGGGDSPESGIEALFQLATGEGLGGWIPPADPCETNGDGAACFRGDALPVVLFVTDNPQHNGIDPALRYPESAFEPERPHDLDQAVDALSAFGARVIGIDAGNGSAMPDLAVLSTRVHPNDADGANLVVRVGTDPGSIAPVLVGAVRSLAETIIQSIDLVVVDPAQSDGVDITTFVARIVPLDVSPPDHVQTIDSNRFVRVRAGAAVRFRIEFELPPTYVDDGPSIFAIDAVLRGDGRARLAQRGLFVAIPGPDGKGRCSDVFP